MTEMLLLTLAGAGSDVSKALRDGEVGERGARGEGVVGDGGDSRIPMQHAVDHIRAAGADP